MATEYTRQQARERVEQSEMLRQYTDTILYVDWSEPEHWAWACTASEDEIASWAAHVERARTALADPEPDEDYDEDQLARIADEKAAWEQQRREQMAERDRQWNARWFGDE